VRVPPASLVVGLVIAALTLAAASSAVARTYGSASIVDVAPDAQFDTADSSVVSADGRYVALRGSVDGHAGIWRRDLQTGALDPVAIDLPGLPALASNYDPQAPSISADGRYIAFNTESPLDPANDTAPPPRPWQVYVRDMNIPVTAPGAYTLASAVNGGTSSLTYSGASGARIAGATTNNAPVDPQFASAGGAITADGRTVVFSVDNQSNLVNPASVTTPPQQVAVRNLDAHTTTLVSVCAYNCASGGTSVGGPISWVGDGLSGGAVTGDDAVISADGTTVAWLSQFGAVQQESLTLTNERILYGGGAETPSIDRQAVWRRIAGGPGAPTLRVTGEADPLSPNCPAGATVTSAIQAPPGCQGPLDVFGSNAEGSLFSHLALSGDGYEVALVSRAPLFGSQSFNQEAYLVDMRAGLTRDQATTALTQAGGLSSSARAPNEGDIVADAISADGSTIALSTTRTRFDLQSPAYLGPARPSAANGNEVYVIDRRSGTIDLASYAYNGTLAAYGSCGTVISGVSPSLSSDGSLLAFDSCANNLIWGDGNESSNVYAEARVTAGTGPDPPPTQVPGAPVATSGLAPLRIMHATVRSLADGNLKLFMLVPGAGRIRVRVTARLRHSSRIVGTASVFVRGAGLATGIVRLRRAYLALARKRGGLRALAELTFTAHGSGGSLHDTIAVTFQRRAARGASGDRSERAGP
jgi:WD40-like Beta Propeller Repeat